MSNQPTSSAPQSAAHVQQQPVEMAHLDSSHTPSAQLQSPERSIAATTPTTTPAIASGTTQQLPPPSIPAPEMASTDASTTRPRGTSSAIGPPSETGAAVGLPSAAGSAVLITLLLPSTGTRHPFKIDEPYLKRRNVVVSSPTGPSLAQAIDNAADAAAGELDPAASDGTPSIDPWDISVYTVKELIWRDWRDEWELRPTSPSAIRLIHFGRLLDDKSALRDLKFNDALPNMIHMSVKPADLDDDEAAGGKLAKISSRTSHPRGRRANHSHGRDHGHVDDGGEQMERPSPGCRCLVM